MAIYMPAAPSVSSEITVAQILKNSGYHTGLIGEWDLGDENSAGAPWKKGFDEFAGYLDPNDAENFYADYIFRYAPGQILNSTNNQREDFVGKEELYPNTQGKNEYIPDLFTKAALNFIKNNQPDQFNHYRPFFLLLNYEIPSRKIEVPTDAPFSEEPWPQPEKNRAALILRIDGYVGQLREQLQKTGMTNNIVIFFSSGSVPRKTAEIDPDFFHSNISTNDFRVPMIVNWPERIPAGQVSGYKWSPQDFLPTAAEIAFTQSPTNIEGTSVLPVLLGPGQKIKSFCAGRDWRVEIALLFFPVRGKAHPDNRQNDSEHNRRQHKPRPFVVLLRRDFVLFVHAVQALHDLD